MRRLSLLVLLFALLIVPVYAQEADTPEITLPDPDVYLDVDWYRTMLVQTVDLWNGGLNGTSGMGVYRDRFDGFFQVDLNRSWQQKGAGPVSTVAHSRAIYMNVEAYRAASALGEDATRFLDAVNIGVAYLLENYRDDAFGGFYWMVNRNGHVDNDQKQDYGNVHPIFALSQSYGITGDEAHLNAALGQVDVIETRFADPDYPGGLLPTQNRDFSEIWGTNNLDAFIHYFEALLSLHDVTTGETQAYIDGLIARQGAFLLNRLYRDEAGFDDRGYVAFNYDDHWNPSQIAYRREIQWSGALHATPGHGVEFAYLLSRAVERGFDPGWLDTADKLLRFATAYALDPDNGGMLYDITDYHGQPLYDNPDNPLMLWWPQAETARAMLHFRVARDAEAYTDSFKAIETLIHTKLMDPVFGGWFRAYAPGRDTPIGLDKGDIWKVNYHFSMFYAEVLRLAEAYPEAVTALNDTG